MRRAASAVMAVVLPLVLSGAALADAAAATVAPAGDIAAMYRNPHMMQFNIKEGTAVLDGKPLAAAGAVIREGRTFIPARALEQSGSATVAWNGSAHEVRVAMSAQVQGAFRDVQFRIGSGQLYSDGQPIDGLTIPAPVLLEGRAYIPVQALRHIGIAGSYAQGVVTCSWSNKVIALLAPPISTDRETADFTVLYEQGMNVPVVLTSLGNSGWLGNEGQDIAKHIVQDGRTYNRMEFRVPLRPGINPLQLTAVAGGTRTFEATRIVSDPDAVPIVLSEDGKDNVSFTSPASGYRSIGAGGTIEIDGGILQQNDLFDQLTIQVEKYEDGAYRNVQSLKLPIENQQFSGSFGLKEEGAYLVQVFSPAYILFTENGPLSTEWAEFVVDVSP